MFLFLQFYEKRKDQRFEFALKALSKQPNPKTKFVRKLLNYGLPIKNGYILKYA